jgi:two-component system chemotaxis response regulator CheB
MVKKRVLIVDDSAFSRQTIKNILKTDPEFEVIGIAFDGIDAIAKTLRYKPDIITLDIEMPEMDGLSFLRWIMKEHPTPVVVISSRSDDKTVFEALELGAIDFIKKPVNRASRELRKIEAELLYKLKNISKESIDKIKSHAVQTEPRYIEPAITLKEKLTDYELIAIGSSTGGPHALQYIFSSLPAINIPVVVSQHMPAGFTRSFAERLDRISKLTVKEAENDEPIEPGRVYICPGGNHLLFKRKGGMIYIKLKRPDPEEIYIPSVDKMISSAVECFGGKIIGIILTGMGKDGKSGMEAVVKNGGYTIAESEETAVVYGMPREVINAGIVRSTLPLYRIPDEIIKILRGAKAI